MAGQFRPWLPVTVIPAASDERPLTALKIRESDARALQAVNEGVATEAQQKAAIAAVLWITGINDLEFLPAEHGGERESAFKSGKRHVGLQLRKLISTPLHLLVSETNDRTEHERNGNRSRAGGGRRAREQ